ncbi:MAG: sulfocyanin-like copper-binding protein [Gemmatimonadaceae bacterium]
MTTGRRSAVLAAFFIAIPCLAVAQGSGGVAGSRTHQRATVHATRAHAAPDTSGNSAGEFMSSDVASKTVKISLTASLGSANGGMNFNGGFKGDKTVTVPVGWSVKMSFVNKDAIPHSAIILVDSFPLPMAPENPAIARAYTNELTGGLPTGGTDSMDFKTTKPGKYLIVCGVPGHGPSGMYIKFDVSGEAKVPSYTK